MKNKFAINILFIITLSIFLVFDSILAQKLPDLIPYRKGGKWGYSDSTKRIVIPCQYDKYPGFFGKDGINEITRAGKIGFINDKGVEIVKAIYDNITGIIDTKLFLVTIQGKKGVINQDGDEIIPIKYDLIYSQNGGKSLIAKTNQKTEIIDLNIRYIYPPKEALNSDKEKTITNKLEVVNNTNEYIPEDTTVAKETNDNHIRQEKDGLGSKILDPQGKWIHVPYFAIEPTKLKNRFFVYPTNYSLKGIMNETGKEIVPAKYEDIVLCSWYYKVKEKNLWGLLDKYGNIILKTAYNDVKWFPRTNLFEVQDQKGFYGIINDGKWVVPCEYSDLSYQTFGYVTQFYELADFIGTVKNGNMGSSVLNIKKLFPLFMIEFMEEVLE